MSFILLTAAVCSIVWGTYLALRGSLLGACVLFLLLTTCFSNHFFQFGVAGVTVTLDRLFLVGLLVAMVIQWRTGRLQMLPPTLGELLLGLFLVLLTISTFTHDWHTTSPTDV